MAYRSRWESKAHGSSGGPSSQEMDAEAKKSEVESARVVQRFKFTNGEVVYSGNVIMKKVDELWDICWAMGQNNEGTKDVLIATIKSQLAHPHVQNNPKLAGLYIGCHPAADKNQPSQSPLTFPLPAPAHQSSILQTISLANPPSISYFQPYPIHAC